MKRSVFLDFFPVPKYLAMPAIGIDISDRSLKYAELRRKKKMLTVSKFGIRFIPKGIIESGEIKQKEKLIALLISLREELKAAHIMVSLPEEKAFLSRVKLPLIKEEEIRGALKVQLEEHIPLSAGEAVFDFELMEKVEKKGESAGHLDINLIAFPRSMVENYRDVFKAAGFMPLLFEMEARAAMMAIVPKGSNDSYFIVDFGKTRTTFSVASNGKIQFTSTINAAGDHLDIALTKNLKIDIFKAERLKKSRGLVRSKDNEQIFNSLLPVVSVIKDEMLRHIMYWNSHSEEPNKKNRPISKILLCGGDSNLIGLPEYFSYELKIPVELCNPWINIASFDEYIPEILAKDSLIYTTALGLALRSVARE